MLIRIMYFTSVGLANKSMRVEANESIMAALSGTYVAVPRPDKVSCPPQGSSPTGSLSLSVNYCKIGPR